jgi:hypothetical protein
MPRGHKKKLKIKKIKIKKYGGVLSLVSPYAG